MFRLRACQGRGPGVVATLEQAPTVLHTVTGAGPSSRRTHYSAVIPSCPSHTCHCKAFCAREWYLQLRGRQLRSAQHIGCTCLQEGGSYIPRAALESLTKKQLALLSKKGGRGAKGGEAEVAVASEAEAAPPSSPKGPLARRNFLHASGMGLAATACMCGTCGPSPVFGAAAQAAEGAPAKWDYQGNAWGGSCNTGSKQSPVDFPFVNGSADSPLYVNPATPGKGKPNLNTQFRYTPCVVTNPGHGTMQVRHCLVCVLYMS